MRNSVIGRCRSRDVLATSDRDHGIAGRWVSIDFREDDDPVGRDQRAISPDDRRVAKGALTGLRRVGRVKAIAAVAGADVISAAS
jgi:hypothetical protein